MSTPNDNTADGAAPGTGQAAPGTSNHPAIDWESNDNPYKEFKARHAGLQGKYQQMTNEYDKFKLQHGDLEEQHTKLTGDFEARSVELTSLKTRYDEATAGSKALQAKYDRLQMVVTQFPDLASFLGADDKTDLLPTGTGDELKAKLTAFRDAMKKQGAAAAKELVQGATGGTPSEQKPKSKEEFLQLAIKAQREGKLDEYDHYYNEFLKAQ